MEELIMRRTNALIIALCIWITFLTGCSAYDIKHSRPTANIVTESTEPYSQFFGTTTILFSDGQDAILIDGFFTRQGLTSHWRHGMTSNRSLINKAIDNIEVEKVDSVFVSHSHFDHAMDSGIVADQLRATLYGSEKTLSFTPNYVNKAVITPGKRLKINEKFFVTAFETPHAEKCEALANIEAFITRKLGGEQYLDADKVYSFYVELDNMRILVIPSSGLGRDDLPKGLKADVVFLGIGLLSRQMPKPSSDSAEISESYIENYWKHAVTATEASLVIPIHFDNFTQPLRNQIPVTPNIIDNIEWTMSQLCALAIDSASAISDKVKIAFPPAIAPFHLDQAQSVSFLTTQMACKQTIDE